MGPGQQGFTHSRPHAVRGTTAATKIHTLTPSHGPVAASKKDSRIHVLTLGTDSKDSHSRRAGDRRSNSDSRTHAFTQTCCRLQKGFTHSRPHTGHGPRAARIHALTPSRRAGDRRSNSDSRTHAFTQACCRQQKGFTHSTPSHWARAPGSKDLRTHALTPCGGPTQQQAIHALTPSHRLVAASKKDSRIHALTLGTGSGQQGFTRSRPHAVRATDAGTAIHALRRSPRRCPMRTRRRWRALPRRRSPDLAQNERHCVVTTDKGNEFRTLERNVPWGVVHRQKRPDRNVTAVVDRNHPDS